MWFPVTDIIMEEPISLLLRPFLVLSGDYFIFTFQTHLYLTVMEYIIHNEGPRSFVEITDHSFILESEQDALDLASLSVENGTSCLLLNKWNLDDKFFDLRTGLAGASLQKFSNYRISFAAVVPEGKIKGRFGEMALESNRGNQFRFFSKKDEAVEWINACKPIL